MKMLVFIIFIDVSMLTFKLPSAYYLPNPPSLHGHTIESTNLDQG